MPEPNDHSDITEIATESKGWLNAVTKHLVWMTPVTCVLAIIYSLIQLGKLPASWLGPLNDISRPFVPFEIDPLICLITSGIALAYWLKRDGWENISRWTYMFGLKARFRELDRIEMEKQVGKQVKERMRQLDPEMLAAARAEALAEVRAKALAEARAEALSAARAEALAEALAVARAEARAEAFAQMGIPDPELPAPPPDGQG